MHIVNINLVVFHGGCLGVKNQQDRFDSIVFLVMKMITGAVPFDMKLDVKTSYSYQDTQGRRNLKKGIVAFIDGKDTIVSIGVNYVDGIWDIDAIGVLNCSFVLHSSFTDDDLAVFSL